MENDNSKLIDHYQGEIDRLKKKLGPLERNNTILEDEQANIAIISSLLHNNHDELYTNLRKAIINFETLIIPNMQGIQFAEKTVSFDELKESNSPLETLKTTNDELMKNYDDVGAYIDTLKGAIGEEVFQINEKIRSYEKKIKKLQ